MLRFASLSSGSSGNSYLIGYGDKNILIDAGISNKRIRDGLESLGIDAESLSAIFVTHEHSDHIQGLKVFLKKTPVPVYASFGTLSELANRECVPHELMHVVKPYESIKIGELDVFAHPSFHDTLEPFWYKVTTPEGSVAVVTDIGHVEQEMGYVLSGLRAILIEANHDINMLETGPYTFALKRRILSDTGHLSNEACGRFLCDILHDGLESIALGHLSKENNYPELALLSVKNEIDFAPIDFVSERLNIFVAGRDNVTKILWK
jgi:phosphoribosyl 1,2-cyclic phosphodiesterase